MTTRMKARIKRGWPTWWKRSSIFDNLDADTEHKLVKRVWYSTLTLMVVLVLVTLLVMWVRQPGPFERGWAFDSMEFNAIGQWFSGIAAPIALWSGAALVVNDRHRQRARDRLAEANEVRYDYRDVPTPRWVVRNGSSRSVTLIIADGKLVEPRTVLPGEQVNLDSATLLARFGYRGDQPKRELVFEDGEYTWTRRQSTISGKRIRTA